MCFNGLGDLILFKNMEEMNTRINQATKSSSGEIVWKTIPSVCFVGLTGTKILQKAEDSAKFSEFREKGVTSIVFYPRTTYSQTQKVYGNVVVVVVVVVSLGSV
ncbi:hypothetical protein OIU85_021507 [Salix viminalis]|uniref:Uncharacterized protein n=1 Tax=Salix viminalis TaxID=40686 RepID=A0A9Q0UIU4_SALVM|nr:hypothetical protein OIU85_021507 [Salix viminalis]